MNTKISRLSFLLFFAGAAGTAVFLSVAVIIYGAALLLTSGESLCLDSLGMKEGDMARQLIHCISLASASAQVLLGSRDGAGHFGLIGIASTMMVLGTGASFLLRSSPLGRYRRISCRGSLCLGGTMARGVKPPGRGSRWRRK